MYIKKKCEDREVYRETKLSGTCYAELNTEIRFVVADARSSGVELLRLELPEDGGSSRLSNCATRVLRAMMRSGLVEFFVPGAELATSSTEAEFLKNKYGALLNSTEDHYSLYTKI